MAQHFDDRDMAMASPSILLSKALQCEMKHNIKSAFFIAQMHYAVSQRLPECKKYLRIQEILGSTYSTVFVCKSVTLYHNYKVKDFPKYIHSTKRVLKQIIVGLLNTNELVLIPWWCADLSANTSCCD